MAIIITFSAPVSCFRIPLHHNYHRSFVLPPPTTVIGMLGAAMGLDETGLDAWLREATPSLGIGGFADGEGKELMTVRKVTQGGKIKKGQFSTIIIRELKTNLDCRFVVECSSTAFEQALTEAVNNPAYPISAGPADFLAMMSAKQEDTIEKVKTDRLHHCVAPGSLWGKARIDADALRQTKLLETVAGPNNWNLPVAWEISKKGARLPAAFAPFTFLVTGVILDTPLTCARIPLDDEGNTLDIPLLGPFDCWLATSIQEA